MTFTAKTTNERIDEGIVDDPKEILASRLIDAWCASHNSQISWQKAIEIVAIITHMPEEEKQRLLALD